MRINTRTHNMEKLSNPNTQNNGFDYTEDFDALQIYNNNKIYFNFKCVVGSGGAQTRSLREVFHFVKSQLEYSLNNKTKNIYFANILDGDESCKHMDKFKYLLSLSEYKYIKKYIYVGELKNVFEWIDKVVNKKREIIVIEEDEN